MLPVGSELLQPLLPFQGTSEEDLSLIRETDRHYLADPFLRVEADEGLVGRVGYTGKP